MSHWNSNTGRGFAGDINMNVGSGDGVFGVLPAPVPTAPNPTYESQTVEELILGPIDMSQVYIDAEVITDSFLVSCIQG
jgi:hypothetical protein